MNDKRKEILKSLLITEEDTLERFEELVKKSTTLFRINGKDGGVIFEIDSLTNAERISLYLIGQYFANELSLVNSYKKSSAEISKDLTIKSTTLSAPLGQLASSNFVSLEDSLYFINHYKISEILDSLITKYANHSKVTKLGLTLKGPTERKKRPSNTKGSSDTNEKGKSLKQESTERQIPDIKYNSSPNGLKDLAKDLEATEDKIKTIFEFENEALHLLKRKHDDKDSQEAFNNAIIYLACFYYHFNQREIAATALIKALTDAGITVRNNFKRDMKNSKRRPYVIDKGEVYKITEEGIKLGLGMVKQMIG
ncbi:MAG: hypothetical protein HYR67_14360 [Bacteroidetes bacterium]|nr:hypothetical protein [Bacteroidota bacterium]